MEKDIWSEINRIWDERGERTKLAEIIVGRRHPVSMSVLNKRWKIDISDVDVDVSTEAGDFVCFCGDPSLCSQDEIDDMRERASHIVDLHNASLTPNR